LLLQLIHWVEATPEGVEIYQSYGVTTTPRHFERCLEPPNFPFPFEGPGPLSDTMLLWATRVSLPNGTTFHPTNVTDITTDCHNRRNHFRHCCL